jgi:outer membrane immunogenic protein
MHVKYISSNPCRLVQDAIKMSHYFQGDLLRSIGTRVKGDDMKKILLGTTALFAMAATPALAADIPVKAPPYIPPVVVAYSWTGCFIGGNGGGLWVKKDWSQTTTGAAISSQSGSGWLVGGQVGCDYQFASSWVIGIQADYDWADASGTANDTGFLTDRFRVRGLGSVTARIGYTPFQRFLAYVRGGVAWERDNYDTTINTPVRFGTVGTTFSTASETRTGWTIGVGGEYAFTDYLSGFAEYDYYAFGTRTNSFASILALTDSIDVRERKSVVKVGLNWRFNWTAPAAVTTRY